MSGFFFLQNMQKEPPHGKDCKCSKVPVTTKQKPMALFDTQIGEGKIFYVLLANGLLTGRKDLAALRLRQYLLTLGFLGGANKKKNHYPSAPFSLSSCRILSFGKYKCQGSTL